MKAEVAALGTEIPQYLTMSAEERIQKGNDLSEEVRSSEERYVGYTGDDVHDRGIKWKVANLKQSFFYVIGRILEEKQSYDVEKQKRSREFHPFDYYLLDRTSIQARERSDYFTQNSNNIPFFSEEYQLRGTSLYPEIRGAYSNGYSILNKKFTLNNSYYKSGYCVVSPSGETTSEDSGLTPDEAEKRLKEKSAEYLTQMRKQFDLNQEIQAKQNELNEIAKEQNTTADAYLVQFGRDSQLDPKTPDYIQLPNVASNITPENRVEGLELLKSIQALEEEMKQLEIRLEEAKKLEDDYAGYKENVPLVIAEGRKLATEGLENWQKVLASPPEDFTDEDLQEINTMIQYYSWVVSWTTNAEKHALNLSINEWEDVLKDKFTRHDDEYMEGITYARGPSSLGLAKYEKEFLADQKAHPFRHFLLSKMNETVKKYFRKYNNQIDLSNFAENQNNENFDVKVYHPQAEAIAGGFHIRKGDFFSTNGILLIREDSQKYPRADFRAKGETAPRKHPYRLIMPDGTEQKINSVTEDEAREMLELEAKEYQTKLVEEFNTLQANKA